MGISSARRNAAHAEYRNDAIRNLVNDAIESWPQFDTEHDQVSGVDLVDWFGEWRKAAKKLMRPLANEASK